MKIVFNICTPGACTQVWAFSTDDKNELFSIYLAVSCVVSCLADNNDSNNIITKAT